MLCIGTSKSNQEQSTQQDEELSKVSNKLQDVQLKDEKTSTTNSTPKRTPIPRETVLIPVWVYRPLTKIIKDPST